MDNGSARWANIALGIWLLISTVLWHHSHGHLISTLVVAFAVITSAVSGFKVPSFRMLASAAGVWLIASLFAWPQSEAATAWHDVIVGIAIILTSAVGPRRERTSQPKRTFRPSH